MKHTPEEIAELLKERPHQPHYIAALVRRAVREERENVEALRRENERLNAVALQAQSAAIDLTKKNERLHDELRQSSIDITRAEVERLKAENERLRDGLACDWAELKACRSRLREHLLEIERLQEALRGIEEGCLDCRRSARAALRREALR